MKKILLYAVIDCIAIIIACTLTDLFIIPKLKQWLNREKKGTPQNTNTVEKPI